MIRIPTLNPPACSLKTFCETFLTCNKLYTPGIFKGKQWIFPFINILIRQKCYLNATLIWNQCRSRIINGQLWHTLLIDYFIEHEECFSKYQTICWGKLGIWVSFSISLTPFSITNILQIKMYIWYGNLKKCAKMHVWNSLNT